MFLKNIFKNDGCTGWVYHELKERYCKIKLNLFICWNFSDGDFETCQKLSDFSTDFVLESTAKMLNVIFNPQKPFETEKPPQSMSARYKFGSKLAQLCLELGFQGQDLGYQTFLYSNENDLRTVFMFLMDKLPKDTEHFTKKSLSKWLLIY